MPRPIVLVVALVFLVSIAEAAGGWLNLLLVISISILLYVLLLRLVSSKTPGQPRSRSTSKVLQPQSSSAQPTSRTIPSRARGALLEPLTEGTTHDGCRAIPSGIDLPSVLVRLVPDHLLHRSGSVFYSGRSAFQRPSRLYVLGLNPGGSPLQQNEETVERDLADWFTLPERWSAYKDESWLGRPPGTCGMQPRVLHLFNELGVNAREVPASNVIFVRSATEATLEGAKGELLPACWLVHQRVIDELGVEVVICFGSTAGRWVREMVCADRLIDDFIEGNARRWRSTVHQSASGKRVVTLSHPGRANWRTPDADPSGLVIRALQ